MSELRRGSEVPIVKRACFELFYLYLLKYYLIVCEGYEGNKVDDHIKSMCNADNIKIVNNFSWDYRWAKINRLLFFMVLEDEYLIYNDTHKKENRLLDVFDAFTIYPSGITECEIYENKSYGLFATLNFYDESYGISYRLDDEEKLTDRFMKTTYMVAQEYEDRISKCVWNCVNRFMSKYNKTGLSLITMGLSLYKLCHSRCDNGNRFIWGDVSKLLLNVVNGVEQELTLETMMSEYQKIRDARP